MRLPPTSRMVVLASKDKTIYLFSGRRREKKQLRGVRRSSVGFRATKLSPPSLSLQMELILQAHHRSRPLSTRQSGCPFSLRRSASGPVGTWAAHVLSVSHSGWSYRHLWPRGNIQWGNRFVQPIENDCSFLKKIQCRLTLLYTCIQNGSLK